jgi:hypothetical protein
MANAAQSIRNVHDAGPLSDAVELPSKKAKGGFSLKPLGEQ